MVDDPERPYGERELVMRALVDGATDVIYLKDQTSRYVFANVAFARMLELTPEAIVGKDDFDLFRVEEAELTRAVDREVLRTGQAQTFVETLTTPRWTRVYHTTKTPHYCRAGYLVGILGVSRDVTANKAQELASAHLAAIVDSSADAIVSATLDGSMISWNAAAERMFGHARQEVLGLPIWMLVSPQERDGLASLHDRVRRGERIENHETVGSRRDGARIALALSLSPITDPRGAIFGTSMIARDITESKRVETTLRETEEWQRLAVEAAELGVWRWSIEDDRLEWTPRCKRLHGLGVDDEVTYPRFLTLLHPDDRESTEHAIRRALAGCAGYHAEHRVIWPDGSGHWISTSGCVLCNSADAPDRMLGVAFDVTARRGAERERAELLRRAQAARAEAQAATRAKDEFLAVLSHELRAPLQSMLGWIQIVKSPGANAALVARGIETIERNIELQTRLIEDLLDVSRIVSGKLRLTPQPVDLGPIVASAVGSVKAATDAKSITLDATMEPFSDQVLGDPARLEQIVVNLLSNAVKFTPSGGSVRVSLERAGAGARITVEDTGAGIVPEFLPHVFERFRQAETTAKCSPGGLGLGLAIVRHLVELHGGTVTAESAGEGQGARFSVTLPLIAAGPG
jgi:PAS domain S-box-containing protein